MNGRAMLWVILAAVMLILIAVAPVVSADGEITWYWKNVDVNTDFTHTSHDADKYMDKTLPEKSSSDKVYLDSGNETWWYIRLVAN